MKYEDLSNFTRGYVDAIFFTEATPDNENLENKTYEDLAPETITKIIADCAGFDMSNTKLLNSAYSNSLGNYDAHQAGVDFWLTRNGHGAGFWDRGLGKLGDELSAACGFKTNYGEVGLYLGDDGKLYLSE